MSEIEAKEWIDGDVVKCIKANTKFFETGMEYELCARPNQQGAYFRNGIKCTCTSSIFEFVRRPSSIPPQVAEEKPVVKESLIAEARDIPPYSPEDLEELRNQARDADHDINYRFTATYGLARVSVEIEACKYIRELAKHDKREAIVCIDEQIATLQNLKRELGPKKRGWVPERGGVEPVVGRFV